MITATIVLSLFVLMLIGTPVGFAMGVAGSIGLYLIGGGPMVIAMLSATPLSTVANYELLSIPMFVLMAEAVVASGIAAELFDTMKVLVGRTRGGLAIATALTGAGFAAISGSSTIGAATLAATSLPAMIERGYDRRLANGVVAISGTLGMLIPPSLALILYSLLADTSIATQLAAGVVPGLIITVIIGLTVKYIVWREPESAPIGSRYSWREKLASLSRTGPFLLLVLAVVGSLFVGIATPSEAAAVGAFVACLLAFLSGRAPLSAVHTVLLNTARVTAMIATILIGAHVFGYALTLTQTTQSIIEAISGLNLNRWVVITLIIAFKLFLGFFMDQFAILVLTVPLMVPIVVSMGFDPIWFGVILILTAEVGMVTPPVGLNAFVIARYTNQPVEAVFAGVLPHVIAHLLAIALFMAFPQLILWPVGVH